MLVNDPQSDKSMDGWVVWSLEQGLTLHYDFLKLNRGLTAITTMLQDAKSPMTLDKIAERVAMNNKIKITRILMRENLLRLRDFASLVGMGTQAGLENIVEGTTPNKTKGLARVRCEALIGH